MALSTMSQPMNFMPSAVSEFMPSKCSSTLQSINVRSRCSDRRWTLQVHVLANAATTLLSLCLLFAYHPIQSSAQTPSSADWPVYRHDAALTSVTLAKGRIDKPQILAEYYLGTPYQELVLTDRDSPLNIADLDGDGSPERFAVSDHTISVFDASGQELWSQTVDGHPLGNQVRVCRLFPDRSDQQIVTFSSRMDTGDGQGYCFSFERGAKNGQLEWTTGPLTGYHSATLVIDDMDGDGTQEIVTAPHYRVQIFDGTTGVLESEVPWDVGRNYGVLVTRPQPGTQFKDVFIVCDFVLHVDCIRFDGKQWSHAWGHKYFDPAAPSTGGRQKYLRVCPQPLVDFDGDSIDEMAYMLVDADIDDTWHLRIRDTVTGDIETDLPGIWVWSITDLDCDGRTEIVYTPTLQKRPATFCDLHVAHLQDKKLADIGVLHDVRPLLNTVRLPLNADSIADEGLVDVLSGDVNHDGANELFVVRKSPESSVGDSLLGASIAKDGTWKNIWTYTKPHHILNLVNMHQRTDGEPSFTVRDLSADLDLSVSATGEVTKQIDSGQPGGFSTMPIVANLDGDGRNEIIVQNAAGQILALSAGKTSGEPLSVVWSIPGMAMNASPGYQRNGTLCPQATDLNKDSKPEVLFAVEDDNGLSALRCVDGEGHNLWTHSFEGCPWGGLQAGVNFWVSGHFRGQQKGPDVYVDVHRRSKASSEGFMLDGKTGEVLWNQTDLVAESMAMPFGGGLPAISDMNHDGIDDLVQEFWSIYGVVSGDTGQPLFTPAPLQHDRFFGRWIAYSSPTVADLDADGQLDVYLNSSSYARGGYAAVKADGKPLWVEFHDNAQGSNGFGPVGDFDGDGQLDIAVGVLDGTLVCLNAVDGTRKWTKSINVTRDIVAGDINNDGTLGGGNGWH
jgi:outer membrane protein assembly factor BamB